MNLILLLQYASLCWLTVSVTSTKIGKQRQDINLDEDGGYTDLLVVIDKEVEENLDILTKLQVIDKHCQSLDLFKLPSILKHLKQLKITNLSCSYFIGVFLHCI